MPTDSGPRFYLGVPELAWLGRVEVPAFLSVRRAMRLSERARGRVKARAPWCLDSGGFSVILSEGGYPKGYERQHINVSRQLMQSAGLLEWAAIPDWMCEPAMLAKTGLTVGEHQRRTVAACVRYRKQAPDVPWIPVLQGWTLDDYLRCVRMYERGGIDLTQERVVGLGSVCIRQGTDEAIDIVRTVGALGIRLHGFGLKTRAMRRLDLLDGLVSADSMAWSIAARRQQHRECDCDHDGDCRNCLRWAIRWRERVTGELAPEPPLQLDLFGDAKNPSA